MKHFILATALAMCLAGCGHRNVWVKPGATQADFNVDRYSCEKDTRQSGYFGTGLVGAINMKNFYDSCMVAHGWHLVRKTRAADDDDSALNEPPLPQISCKLPAGFDRLTSNACQAKGGVPSTPDQLVSCQIPGRSHPSYLTNSQCAEANVKAPPLTTPASVASDPTSVPVLSSTRSVSVLMQKAGGTYVVPVLIHNSISLNFIVDSGASDVSIPADVAMTLVRTGTLLESDFIGHQTYVLADGSKMPSATFRLRSLKVGDKVVENVKASLAPVQGSLLLGQSFLGRLRSWSVDNNKHALVFE